MSPFLEICKTTAIPLKLLRGSVETLISSLGVKLDKP